MATILQHINSLDLVDWSSPVNRCHPLSRGLVSWWATIPNRAGWGSYTMRDLLHRNNLASQTNAWRIAGRSQDSSGALLFDDASSQYAEISKPVVTSYPLTMACWFRTDSVTINQILMSIVDNSQTTTDDAELGVFGTVGGDPLRARKDGQNGSSVGTVVANQWMFATGVFEASQVTAYLDGAAGTPNAQTQSLNAAADTTSIGRRNTGATANLYMSGYISDAMIWNRALTSVEVLTLYRESLRGYPNMLRNVPLHQAFIEPAAVVAARQRALMLTGVGS